MQVVKKKKKKKILSIKGTQDKISKPDLCVCLLKDFQTMQAAGVKILNSNCNYLLIISHFRCMADGVWAGRKEFKDVLTEIDTG